MRGTNNADGAVSSRLGAIGPWSSEPWGRPQDPRTSPSPGKTGSKGSTFAVLHSSPRDLATGRSARRYQAAILPARRLPMRAPSDFVRVMRLKFVVHHAAHRVRRSSFEHVAENEISPPRRMLAPTFLIASVP